MCNISAGLQEHDLKAGLGQGQQGDVAVYLGLAATAFLLVMLHPSKEDSKAKASTPVPRPPSQAGLQVCLRPKLNQDLLHI